MQAKTSQAPTINLNLLIQNFINVSSTKENFPFFDQSGDQKFRNMNFPKQNAKTYRNSLSPKQLHTSVSFSTDVDSPVQTSENTTSFSNKVTTRQSEIYEERKQVSNSHLMEILGFLLVGFAAFLFITVIYAVIVSPLIGDTGHIVLDFVRKDNYYCLLAPLMIPMSLAILYANWVSVKFFRHT